MPNKDEIQYSVQGFILQKRKIDAIKYVREQLGWGLKTGKLFVDMLTDPRRDPDNGKVTGCPHFECTKQTPPHYGLHPRTREPNGHDLFFACEEHEALYKRPHYSNPESDSKKTPVLTFWPGGCLRTVDDEEATCTTCGAPSGQHRGMFPHACSSQGKLGDYYTHPLFEKNPGKLPKQEKQMPTRQYGTNQKMTAKFPGKCWLCSKQIIENLDSILPLLSERTPRGRHPWVHEACFLNDEKGEVSFGKTFNTQTEDDGDTALIAPSKWLVDPPPVSQRQRNVIAQNLEAILKALANNPGQVFALVPVTETAHPDAVIQTTSIGLKTPSTTQEAAI